MESLEISLPKPLKDFIDAEVGAGAYASPSAFIGDLVRAAQQCKDGEWLEAQLLQGLEGEGTEATPEWWQAFYRRLDERNRAKAGAP
jgi:antitoxin ParD1/3/4